jgi:hypothetical protein
MIPSAELVRMQTEPGPSSGLRPSRWGVAITVQGQDTTEGGRFFTLTLDRPLAEAYASALSQAVVKMRQIHPDVARFDGMRVAHHTFGSGGKPFPHVFRELHHVENLISEISKACHEIRVKERGNGAPLFSDLGSRK